MHHLARDDDGEPLALSRRRTLRWVVVSAYGAERTARVSDGHRRRLLPRDLELPTGVDLYLLACYQGREENHRRWADQTQADVHGVTSHIDLTENHTQIETLHALSTSIGKRVS